MDGVALLQEAREAGLVVQAEGSRLVIRGPRSAEALALRLLDHKAEVLEALGAEIASVPLPVNGDIPAADKGAGSLLVGRPGSQVDLRLSPAERRRVDREWLRQTLAQLEGANPQVPIGRPSMDSRRVVLGDLPLAQAGEGGRRRS